MFMTEKGKNKLIAECYESVVEVHNDEPFNPVRTISILEAGSVKENVYYTNKRDYIDEEWYNITTGAPAVASENATRLHKLFESKRIEVRHIIQTASQPSSAMNCIPQSLNKQPVLTAKPSVSQL